MHWNQYKSSHPNHGDCCIVAYINNGKTMLGVFTYFYAGDSPYWVNDNHLVINCSSNQLWFNIEGITRYVERRMLDEFRDTTGRY